MTEIHDRFDRALELGDRLSLDWRGLERRIRDTIPDLAAASYDSEPSDPIVWCDEHERPVRVCHKADEYCTGTPLARKTDPTGDGAVNNRGYEDAGAWIGHAKKVCHHLEQMARIAGRYRIDDPRQSKELEEENAKPDGCEVCARSDKWVPAYVDAANPNGALSRPTRTCRWHYDFVALHGRLPDEREEAIHQAGGRVTVRTKQVDRLRRGLQTGALR